MTDRERELVEALRYFKPPFEYQPTVQSIYGKGFEGASQKVLDVRGWGGLTGHGHAYKMSGDEADNYLDKFGKWVADALNRAAATEQQQQQQQPQPIGCSPHGDRERLD